MRNCTRRGMRWLIAGAAVGSAGGEWPNMTPADAGIPLPAIGSRRHWLTGIRRPFETCEVDEVPGML